jgi:4-amino-4-deoxy-L-arabinose transferase-like glycosyltransferase
LENKVGKWFCKDYLCRTILKLKLKMNWRTKDTVYTIIILLIAYFPLFLHLEVMPFMVWDESRLAESAFEMLQNRNYWVVTYGNAPDLWSVKPPLMIWIIAGSFKLLGYNALALRLPSALFGFITILIIYQFCKQFLKNRRLAFLSVFVLLTSGGYVDYHVTRTGDYDALLILFQLLFVLYFSKHYFETDEASKKNYKNLYWSALFLALALLTKGIAALFVCPGLIFFLMIEKKLKSYVLDKHTYIAVLIAITPLILYFGWREYLSSGYLKAVWEMEFINRYLNGDGDTFIINQTFLEKIQYYWSSMYHEDFKPWLYLLPVGIFSIYKHPNSYDQKILQLFLWNVFFLMMLISFSSSKKGWYEAPVYPYLAVIVGNGLDWLWQQFEKIIEPQQSVLTKINLYLILFVFMMVPYWLTFQKFHSNTDTVFDWQKRQYSPFMLKVADKTPFYVLQTNYNAAVQFTQNILNEKSASKIYTVTIQDKQYYPHALQIGSKVLFCDPVEQDSLQKYFHYKVIENYRTCQFVEIIDKKR